MKLDELKSMFHYEPSTGVFTNISRRANCVYSDTRAGHVNAQGYRIIKIKQKAYKAHRLAFFYVTGQWPSGQIDHINGQKDDNIFSNLRDVDCFTNAQNWVRGAQNSHSGLIGAHRGGWKKRRWVSDIQHNGQRTYLGIFNTAREAHEAYLKAKRELHQGCTI